MCIISNGNQNNLMFISIKALWQRTEIFSKWSSFRFIISCKTFSITFRFYVHLCACVCVCRVWKWIQTCQISMDIWVHLSWFQQCIKEDNIDKPKYPKMLNSNWTPLINLRSSMNVKNIRNPPYIYMVVVNINETFDTYERNWSLP